MKILEKLIMNKSKPKPPKNKSKTIVKAIEEPEKQSLMLRLRIMKNNIMNKYYYHFLERFLPKFNNFLIITYIESKKIIRLAIWSVIVLFILRLLGYNITRVNYFSSVSILLALKQLSKFILKLMRIED